MRPAIAILLATLSIGATYADRDSTVIAWTHLTRERAIALGNHHPRQKVYGYDFSQGKLREVVDLCCGWTIDRDAAVMVVESSVPLRAVGDSTRMCRPPQEYTDGVGHTYFVIWPSAVPESFTVTAMDTTLTLEKVQ